MLRAPRTSIYGRLVTRRRVFIQNIDLLEEGNRKSVFLAPDDKMVAPPQFPCRKKGRERPQLAGGRPGLHMARDSVMRGEFVVGLAGVRHQQNTSWRGICGNGLPGAGEVWRVY